MAPGCGVVRFVPPGFGVVLSVYVSCTVHNYHTSVLEVVFVLTVKFWTGGKVLQCAKICFRFFFSFQIHRYMITVPVTYKRYTQISNMD